MVQPEAKFLSGEKMPLPNGTAVIPLVDKGCPAVAKGVSTFIVGYEGGNGYEGDKYILNGCNTCRFNGGQLQVLMLNNPPVKKERKKSKPTLEELAKHQKKLKRIIKRERRKEAKRKPVIHFAPVSELLSLAVEGKSQVSFSSPKKKVTTRSEKSYSYKNTYPELYKLHELQKEFKKMEYENVKLAAWPPPAPYGPEED